jgi:hypothetical protein
MYSRPGIVNAQPWQCPVCGRTERTRLRGPRCTGTPESPHRATRAERVPGSITPADNWLLFS